VTNITYSHNLWINNQSRNPKAKGRIQYINNVVYNWGVCGLVGGHSASDHFLDAIGNYFIAGPDSSSHFAGEFKATDHVFQKDNVADMNRDGKLNGRAVVAEDFGSGESAPTFVTNLTVAPQISVTVESAPAAFSNVVAHAGCSLHRDSVDARLIDFKVQRRRVDAIAQAGGFRAVVEKVAEVAAAMRAQHLRAVHPQTVIVAQNDFFLRGQIIKTRPAAAGVELGVRSKNDFPARRAAVNPRFPGVPILAGERPLRVGLAQHTILFRRQFLAPFRVGFGDWEFHGLIRG
jgi:hypothetical protein